MLRLSAFFCRCVSLSLLAPRFSRCSCYCLLSIRDTTFSFLLGCFAVACCVISVLALQIYKMFITDKYACILCAVPMFVGNNALCGPVDCRSLRQMPSGSVS